MILPMHLRVLPEVTGQVVNFLTCERELLALVPLERASLLPYLNSTTPLARAVYAGAAAGDLDAWAFFVGWLRVHEPQCLVALAALASMQPSRRPAPRPEFVDGWRSMFPSISN